MKFRSVLAAFLLYVKPSYADDIQTLYERRIPFIVSESDSSAAQVNTYAQTLQPNGTWTGVDYTSGCAARRASWPAFDHWVRILAVAAAYHGGVDGAEQYVHNPSIRITLGRAMQFWFANDFSTIGNGACMDGGGVSGDKCPCGTPGLWNTNWFSNVIMVPRAVGQVCLLLRDEPSPTELGNCTLITARAYTPFYRNHSPGYLSGANIIDIASIRISAGLLENNRAGNQTRIEEAYQRVHNEVVVHPEDWVDGIKPDGSFQQHKGVLYDGNYGKDFSNSVLELELQAVGTRFQADQSVRNTLGLHIGGARWKTFANTITKTVHWDFSVLGRMITFPVIDNQASANLKMNFTEVRLLGEVWSSSELVRFGTDLADTNPTTANAGHLNGNRMFWDSDYMAHRTRDTVTTIKMLSNSTTTSECTNGQNLKGFHLSDGAVYTYTTGAEYEDMYATFDFGLVPGTTTDYGNTPLECGTTRKYGSGTYAGGVSAGDLGAAAMEYVNPLTGALSFRKAYFFFGDNVQHVLVNSIRSNSSAPVFSVLDQRLLAGNVYVNSKLVGSGNYSSVNNLWHGNTGYVLPSNQNTKLSIDAKTKTGSWSAIGVSTQPPSTKNMFSAWIVHDSSNLAAPIEYSVFPATWSQQAFRDKARSSTPVTISNNNRTSAAIDATRRTLGAAFWGPKGGSVSVPQMDLIINVDKPVMVILKLHGSNNSGGEISVADPTQSNTNVNVQIVWVSSKHRRHETCIGHYCIFVHGKRGGDFETTLKIDLPTGGMAGSTVTQIFKRP